jgi:hypothetical protein
MFINLKSMAFRKAANEAVNEIFRPIVGYSSATFACYKFAISECTNKTHGVVLFVHSSGNASATCNCLAHLNGRICWHIVKAVQHHSSLVRSGVRAPLQMPQRLAVA